MLVVVCAWCERFLGLKETPGRLAVSHGMCTACQVRQQWDEPPTLVFAREHADLLPVFKEILRGTPEIPVVIDRRVGERRRQPAPDPQAHRRGPDRRRRSSPTLL